MMKTGLGRAIILLVVLVFTLGAGNALALEGEDSTHPRGWDEGEKTGWGQADVPPGQAKKEQIERLKKLRQDDPEKFKEIIKKRKQVLRDKLEKIKKNDPEKYDRIMRRRQNERKRHLEELKKNDPEKFKEIIGKRKQDLGDKLGKIKENDPKKYEQIMRRRQNERKRHLEKLKKNDPKKYKQLIKKNPRLADHLEDIRDRREDRREDIRDRRNKRIKGNPPGPKGGPGAGPKYKSGNYKNGKAGSAVGRKTIKRGGRRGK